jgi:hypothetical protein
LVAQAYLNALPDIPARVEGVREAAEFVRTGSWREGISEGDELAYRFERFGK